MGLVTVTFEEFAEDQAGDPVSRDVHTVGAVPTDSGPVEASDIGDLKLLANRWKWMTERYDFWGRVFEKRMYFKIPGSGEAPVRGEHYEQVTYGYDEMDRVVRVEDETGTITRTVYDPRGLVLEEWTGTDDAGATDSEPHPAGAPSSNDMELVVENTYDEGADSGGDGHLTKIRRPAGGGAPDREEERSYDARGFLTETNRDDGERSLITRYSHDRQGRRTGVVRYRDQVGAGYYLGSKTIHHTDQGWRLVGSAPRGRAPLRGGGRDADFIIGAPSGVCAGFRQDAESSTLEACAPLC